jgi:hypothetical protein
MSFQIRALPVAPFEGLFGLTGEALAARGVMRRTVDVSPGFPCRVSLEDAAPGETVLLLHYEHQSVRTPYRASHAIYVREGAREARPAPGEIPLALARRLLSVRAFDAYGMMIDADVVRGETLPPLIGRFFDDARVAYLHLHNAKPGCYAARVARSSADAAPTDSPGNTG